MLAPVVKQRVTGDHAAPPEDDRLAVEAPLEISLACQRDRVWVSEIVAVTMRTPGHDADLVRGYLFCEGIVTDAADIESMDFRGDAEALPPKLVTARLRPGATPARSPGERKNAVHASCGVCGAASLESLNHRSLPLQEDATRVEADWVHSLPERMHRGQALFHATGGIHASALFDPGGDLLVVREDIGRHNALDKAIGARAGDRAAGAVLCVSGRTSYEIVQKALAARIPIIAGVGAPSSLAVAMANDYHVTLIGFLRDGAFNLYSRPERILTRHA